MRQPRRALPAQDRQASSRRTSTSPPSRRACASIPTLVGRDELIAAVEAAGYDVRPSGRVDRCRGLRSMKAADVDAQRRERETRVLGLAKRLPRSPPARDDGARAVATADPAARASSTGAARARRRSCSSCWAGASTSRRGARRATASANMSTLVVLGTTAAWLYQRSSPCRAGPGVAAPALQPMTYFDSAAVIIGLVLAGPLARGTRQGATTGAVRRLIGLQPRVARVVRDGMRDRRAARRGPAATSCASGPARSPGRRRIIEGATRGRRVDADRRGHAGRRRAPATRSSAATLNTTRQLRVPRDARRARHGARADRAAGRARRRARRRRSSAWPTRSRAGSCRRCSCSRR